MQVKRPERPGAALVGTDGIDHAPAATVFFFRQKDAVFGGSVFFNAVFEADTFEVFLFDLLDRCAQMFGEKLDFRLGDPDIALFRAGAAIAATGALKMQSALVPFIRSSFRIHRSSFSIVCFQ